MLKRCFVFLFNAWDNIVVFLLLILMVCTTTFAATGLLGLITLLVLARLVKGKEKPCCEIHVKIELLEVSKCFILTFLLGLA